MRLSTSEKVSLLNTAAEEKWLIDIPHYIVLHFAIILLSTEFLLISFTNIYSAIVTIPIMIYWFAILRWYIKIWKAYQYSCIYIVLFATSVALAAAISGRTIRMYACLTIQYLLRVITDLIHR